MSGMIMNTRSSNKGSSVSSIHQQISNLQMYPSPTSSAKLPEQVLHYLHLRQKIKNFNAQIKDLQTQIKSIEKNVTNFVKDSNTDKKVFISFSTDEEKQIYGDEGFLSVKESKTRETLTKESIQRLLYEYFVLVFKDKEKNQILKFAQSAVEYMYSNRKVKESPIALNRTFSRKKKKTMMQE